MSPTQRSLQKLRKAGWTAQVVERWNAYAKKRIDLFGFIDIVAMRPTGGIVGVQATSGANVSARLKKIGLEPRAPIWRASGGKILIHGWSKKGPKGKRKTWECREVEIENKPPTPDLTTEEKSPTP